jgi:uncharacterized protein YjbI with pentapeptide repeats
LPDGESLQRGRKACLDFVSTDASHRGELAALLTGHALPAEVVSILRHEPMAMIFAADQMAEDLRSQSLCEFLGRQLPRALVQLVAQQVPGDAEAIASLRAQVRGLQSNHAMAASILHAANVGWVPDSDYVPLLTGGYFAHAGWGAIRLTRGNLSKADLSSSDLQDVVLNQARIIESNLRRANLSNATCISMDARHSNLSNANLSSVCAERAKFDHATLSSANLDDANLTGASFFECDLSDAVCRRADFTQSRWGSSKIDGADFSDAIFNEAHLGGLRLTSACFAGARFRGACLALANLEDMTLPDADFLSADLSKAMLTGSQMHRGNFLNADLRGAGLADIDWEGACLRHADLRDANFHMGSTRSGLLFTPIACEGTRTGFYTDDFDEQTFKAPEEIRKANLRGADLRGAKVEGTDFYLVDLRDALYDPEQGDHFRRCKAILKSPCVE